jgi:hypothetical protein
LSVIIDGTAGITFPVTAGSASAVQASSGRVLQVVQATSSTTNSTAGTSYVDTGLTATITPSSSSSKVLVSVILNFYISGGGADNGCAFQLVRGSTAFLAPLNNSVYLGGPTASTEIAMQFPLIYLDSPSTTSATTYKIQMLAANGATVVARNADNTAVMQLMEIAA